MKRLSLLIVSTAVIFAIGFTTYLALASKSNSTNLGSLATQSGNANSATVSFGGWMTNTPVDRFPNLNPGSANHHSLTPRLIRIQAGETVNFIVGGFHQVVVYDDGTQPSDISVTTTVPPTNGGPPLINDSRRRIYRGLDPSLQPQDRVEAVLFERPGTYLVICGVRPHFVNDSMYGFVVVVPKGDRPVLH